MSDPETAETACLSTQTCVETLSPTPTSACHHLFMNKQGSCRVCLQIRRQMAKEFIVDLKDVAEENNTLLRESLTSSLEKMMSGIAEPAADAPAEEPAP